MIFPAYLANSRCLFFPFNCVRVQGCDFSIDKLIMVLIDSYQCIYNYLYSLLINCFHLVSSPSRSFTVQEREVRQSMLMSTAGAEDHWRSVCFRIVVVIIAAALCLNECIMVTNIIQFEANRHRSSLQCPTSG